MSTQSTPSINIELLPIYIFFWIAGADNDINQQETNTFLRLIDRTNWCKSRYFIDLVHKTNTLYPSVSKQYFAGNLTLDSSLLRSILTQIKNEYPQSQMQKIDEDLKLLCKSIARSSGGFVGLSSVSHCETQAIIVIHQLIKETLLSTCTIRKSEPSPVIREQVKITQWHDGPIDLKCINIIDETIDAKTFRFKMNDNRKFKYSPGQFITFLLEIEGKPVSRSYTISSSPTRNEVLEVTIKKIKGGLVSNWMFEHVTPNMILKATGPNGHFTCKNQMANKNKSNEQNQDTKFLFLSAGSGVTPMMSMVRYLHDQGRNNDIIYLNCTRTQNDIIFKEEIELSNKRMSNLTYHYTLSGDVEKSWNGFTGRISKKTIEAAVPDLHERQIYLCGPDPFKQTAETILTQLAFDMSNYHYESFGGKPIDFDKIDGLDTQQEFEVQYSQSSVSAKIKANQTLLDHAEQSGISINNACRSGVCGSCKVKVTHGKVRSLVDDNLSFEEKNEGFVLACVCLGESNLSIEA